MVMAFLWAKYILIGGAAFWLTDAGFMLLSGIVPTRLWIIAKTILLPLVIVITARAITRKKLHACSPASRAYLMLAGIWVLGPVYLLFVTLVYDNLRMSLGEAVFHVALFPLSTIVISTYSGALGGLIIASIFLCLSGFTMHGE